MEEEKIKVTTTAETFNAISQVNIKLGTMEEKMKQKYYYVFSPETGIFIDDDGKIWRGGSNIFLPIFISKKEAYAFKRKVKRILKIESFVKLYPARIIGVDRLMVQEKQYVIDYGNYLEVEILIEEMDSVRPFVDTNSKNPEWWNGLHYGLKMALLLLEAKLEDKKK